MVDVHWADAIAGALCEVGNGDSHVVASGITPSGEIHIGNMREVVTADAVYRALEDRGTDVRLIYIADTFDPLRTVYPFLPLEETSHRSLPGGWSPFNPLCPECERIVGTRVLGFNSEEESVDVACTCGFQGVVSVVGGGKLTWRVDWPARWEILGVTVEPFGKDHATRGGQQGAARMIQENGSQKRCIVIEHPIRSYTSGSC